MRDYSILSMNIYIEEKKYDRVMIQSSITWNIYIGGVRPAKIGERSWDPNLLVWVFLKYFNKMLNIS